MIYRRYGSSLHSVVPSFDSKALTEIGFRRDHTHSHPADEFDQSHEKVRAHELVGSAEGFVQDEVEQVLLADLASRIGKMVAELGEEEVLVVENEQGVAYPKTHTHQKTVVIEGENKFHFTTTVHPPLRVAVYRRSAASR